MNWDQVGKSVVDHGFAWGASVGVTFGLGGGAGLITFLHHMPPPYADQQWWGAVYDSLQDLSKNMDRIGARRERKKEKPE